MNTLAINIVLLADFESVVKIVVALLFVAFWILGQLGDLKKPKKAMQPGRKIPRDDISPDISPDIPPRGLPDQQAQPDQADPLRRRVEEMLQQAGRGNEAELEARQLKERHHSDRDAERHSDRRVEERRAASQQSRPQNSPQQKRELHPAIELLSDDAPPAKPPQRRSSIRQRRPAAGPRSISEHVSHLGEEVALADDKVEARLHAKFDHDLGQLTDTHNDDAYDRTVATNVAANQIAALLADPQSIRQAILLQEILKRPEERW